LLIAASVAADNKTNLDVKSQQDAAASQLDMPDQTLLPKPKGKCYYNED